MRKFITILLFIFISNFCNAEHYFIPKDNKIIFDIIRKNKSIGTHSIFFNKKNEYTNVKIEVDIKVKIGFLTVYKYSHNNNERWSGNELHEIQTKSITNSKKKYSVKGKRINNIFEFIGVDGKQNTNKNVIPISYWNKSLIERNEFLDSQKGIIRKSKIKFISEEQIKYKNKNFKTKKYEFLVLTKHSSDEKPFPIIYLWYTEIGELMKLQFDSPEDNSIIEYVRVE